jgi:hypothetical protein
MQTFKIQDILEIVDFEFQICELKTHIWDSKWFQMKTF